MKPVKLSKGAYKGWAQMAELRDIEVNVLLEIIGLWLADMAKNEGMAEGLRNLLDAVGGPKTIIANGPGAQAAGRDLINAVVHEHHVAPEDGPKIISLLLESLKNKQQPSSWSGQFATLRSKTKDATAG